MSLSYSAVRTILTSTGSPLTQQEVVEFFHIVDEDQDGMLHIDELMKVQCDPPFRPTMLSIVMLKGTLRFACCAGCCASDCWQATWHGKRH